MKKILWAAAVLLLWVTLDFDRAETGLGRTVAGLAVPLGAAYLGGVGEQVAMVLGETDLPYVRAYFGTVPVLYPLGAGVGMYIFLLAWTRGRRVEWKGRSYVVKSAAEMP